MVTRYFVGIDFGMAVDHTAVSVLAYTETKVDDDIKVEKQIQELRRLPLGIEYTTIVALCGNLLSKLPQNTLVLADATGVGRPIIEMLYREIMRLGLKTRLISVIITGGIKASYDGNTCRLPKRELILSFVSALQKRELAISALLQHAPILIEEMRHFKMKTTAAGNETYESWRERDHDDLVFSAALVAWGVEKFWTPLIPRPIKVTYKKKLGPVGTSELTLDEAWADAKKHY